MENMQFRHRNSARHNFTMTSNNLLFRYHHVSDPAKITYQVIDSFDWTDLEGNRKGYAYPSIGRIAGLRGVSDRCVQRHIRELMAAGLLTREMRPGLPSLLTIEEPEAEAIEEVLTPVQGRGDKTVTPSGDKNVTPHNKTDEGRNRRSDVNEGINASREGTGSVESLGELLSRRRLPVPRVGRRVPGEFLARRDYLAAQMLSVLGDGHSLGFYRLVAQKYPEGAIFLCLGQVKEALRAGSVRKGGALFATLIRERTTTAR